MLISQEARDLIVLEEVSSRKHYEQALHRPTWPGLSSGVTIGVGYDVGAGVTTKAQLHADWDGLISPAMVAVLEPAVGVTGSRAQALAAKLKSRVMVPWDTAIAFFDKKTVPKWYETCKRYLPNFEELSLDCKGALLSLTYNRGPSYSKQRTASDTLDRYREMRTIKSLMVSRQFNKIPAQIKSMKRIWSGTGYSGLLKRRDREAALFEKGLKQPAASTLAPVPAAVSPPPKGQKVAEAGAAGTILVGGGLVVAEEASKGNWKTVAIVLMATVLGVVLMVAFIHWVWPWFKRREI